MKRCHVGGLLPWAMVFLSLLAIKSASAGDIPGYPDSIGAYDPREVALLPRYCMHTKLFRDHVPGGNNIAEIDRWTSIQGQIFNAMHHYCWGLMHTNRAVLLAKTAQTRNFHLGSSISEFNYVIERSPKDFVLLPEILTKKGENLIRLGNAPLGVKELEEAIQLKADYWPPYTALSDYYKDTGNLSKARELLKKALSFAPNAKPVQRRLAELDAVPREPKQRR